MCLISSTPHTHRQWRKKPLAVWGTFISILPCSQRESRSGVGDMPLPARPPPSRIRVDCVFALPLFLWTLIWSRTANNNGELLFLLKNVTCTLQVRVQQKDLMPADLMSVQEVSSHGCLSKVQIMVGKNYSLPRAWTLSLHLASMAPGVHSHRKMGLAVRKP